MLILFLIGLFCFLLVVGFVVTGGKASLSFAIMSLVVLAALAFVGFVGFIIYAILPH
jgi:hypothetical protein